MGRALQKNVRSREDDDGYQARGCPPSQTDEDGAQHSYRATHLQRRIFAPLGPLDGCTKRFHTGRGQVHDRQARGTTEHMETDAAQAGCIRSAIQPLRNVLRNDRRACAAPLFKSEQDEHEYVFLRYFLAEYAAPYIEFWKETMDTVDAGVHMTSTLVTSRRGREQCR